MKKLNLLFALLLTASVGFAQTTWTIDKAHSQLGFSITHLMVSDVEGKFKNFDAKIVSSKDDLTDAMIDLTAEVPSISTENDQRDKHLQSPDYFDAAKFPTFTFKSKSFKKMDEKHYKLTGDLTLHGVTKTVELDVKFNGTAVHPQSKKTIAGFKITGTIKRSDFGIGTGTPSTILSEEVTIDANAEFVKG